MSAKLLVFVALATGALSTGSHETQLALANPIRKVVTMLQSMQAKVQEEGEKELALYDKYMCYCKTAGGDLKASIAGAEESISELGNKIKAAEEQMVVLKEELKTAQADRAAAKAAMAEATAKAPARNPEHVLAGAVQRFIAFSFLCLSSLDLYSVGGVPPLQLPLQLTPPLKHQQHHHDCLQHSVAQSQQTSQCLFWIVPGDAAQCKR